MLHSGDVVDLDLGVPAGHEAGYRHPAIVVTAQRILESSPSVVHVVPLTSTTRSFASEVDLEPDVDNGLRQRSTAQCQHLRAVVLSRVVATRGNVGGVVLAQIRESIAAILDLPG